ncbi:zinc finger protein 32 isoform X10 [Rattus norvegicus]
MGIAAPTHMTALPSNQNQPAPGQRSWFLPRHRGDASHSASRHAQAPGSCGPATRSIAAAATGSTPALSVCGRAPLRYSSPAHGSIIRRGGDQSHRAGADMFGFPTATLLDCHGRYAQNVAFFNVMTEAHKYDSSEATGSSSWDFQSSFRREKLEQKSPDSKALQEDSPGVRQKVYDCQECGKSFRQKGRASTPGGIVFCMEKSTRERHPTSVANVEKVSLREGAWLCTNEAAHNGSLCKHSLQRQFFLQIKSTESSVIKNFIQCRRVSGSSFRRTSI